MLTHIEEPFKVKQFGGDPASLQYVTSYLKSMSELARNTEALKKKEVEKGTKTPPPASPREILPRATKRKQREKEKDKQTTDA